MVDDGRRHKSLFVDDRRCQLDWALNFDFRVVIDWTLNFDIEISTVLVMMRWVVVFVIVVVLLVFSFPMRLFLLLFPAFVGTSVLLVVFPVRVLMVR